MITIGVCVLFSVCNKKAGGNIATRSVCMFFMIVTGCMCLQQAGP